MGPEVLKSEPPYTKSTQAGGDVMQDCLWTQSLIKLWLAQGAVVCIHKDLINTSDPLGDAPQFSFIDTEREHILNVSVF